MNDSYCCLCDEPITQLHFDECRVSDHKIYKCGELSYIELAHTWCTSELGNWTHPDPRDKP